ncbi:hypothetical protein HN954_01605 [bacterium]|jgi:hypothetical protein|nr:hypothetical protein [bacterium]MBT6831546.1 hypothetical protein [bacterium]MBT6996105.1 hypothetical protein [bacterium]MBT7772737.1 hypothetical protein [bacterium]
MNALLFTTTRCPKCPAFKKFVEETLQEFDGEMLDETMPHFMDEAAKFGVTAAPLLIIFENGNEVFRGSEISEIQDFLKK